MESTSIQVVVDMRANGRTACSMEKERRHLKMVVFTRARISRVRRMDKVCRRKSMAFAIKASFRTDKGLDLARAHGQMAARIRVYGLKEKERAWECTLIKTEHDTMDFITIIKSMVSELKHIQIQNTRACIFKERSTAFELNLKSPLQGSGRITSA